MNLDTLLRDTGTVPDASQHTLMSARATLDEAVTATGARREDAIRIVRERRRRRIRVSVLTSAAAALALVIGPTLGVGGTAPVASADAAVVLMQASVAAGEQPGGWPDAAYWHSVSTYHQGSSPTQTREIWIGHAAPGVFDDPGVVAGILPLGVSMFSAGGTQLTWDQLYALPTEPVALERRLRAGINGAGNGDDAELFVIVGDLLRESPASPALRRALWEVAAAVPGVTLVGDVIDAAGRSGVAVERDYQRYVLDPTDGRLLEDQQDGPDGWVGTYLEQGPADSAPAATLVDRSASDSPKSPVG